MSVEQSQVIHIPMPDPLLSGYDFGKDGPPTAWYRSNGAEDAAYLVYTLISSGDQKDEAAAVYYFNEAFHEWLAGRSKHHVVWRRRPAVEISKCGLKYRISARCVYDPEFNIEYHAH